MEKISSKFLAAVMAMSSIIVLTVAGTAAQASTTTLEAVEDAEIDENINWRNDTKGVPLDQWRWTAESFRIQEYENGEHSDVLIKWDPSGIDPSHMITDATMELVIEEWPDGPIEVYGIKKGNWAEKTVTWSSWDATEKTLELLGSFTGVGPPGTVCTFCDPDLTAWVQAWVDGDQKNNGLILKWAGTPYCGDQFTARETPWAKGAPPRLVVESVGEPATLSLLLAGGLTLIRRRKENNTEKYSGINDTPGNKT